MPVCDDLIQQIATHIIDPISEQSIKKLIYDFGLSKVFQNNIIINSDYSGVTGSRDKYKNAKLRHNRIECNISANLNPLNVAWSEVTTFKHTPGYGLLHRHMHMYYPIFQDPKSDIYLYEQVSPASIQISGEMILLNKDLAYSISSMFFNKYNDGSIMKYEHLIYDYPIPKKTKHVIYNLWKHRELYKHVPFSDYLKICSGNQISLLLNKEDLYHDRDKKRMELIIKKTDLKALVKIEHSDEKPTPEKVERLTSEYRISFTYTIQFSRPNTLYLSYPIIIDNKVLPSQLISIKNNRQLRSILGDHPNALVDNYFKAWQRGELAYLQIPYYDDWAQPLNSILITSTYKEILVAAFTIDENENGDAKEYTVINLDNGFSDDENKKGQVFSYDLHEYVKQIISAQCCGSFNLDCLFNIAIYKDNAIIDPSNIRIDYNLNIYIPHTDKTSNYHLIISELQDLKLLNSEYYWLLEEYEEMFNVTNLDNFNPNWRDSTNNNIGVDGYAITKTFRVLIADIYPYKQKRNNYR